MIGIERCTCGYPSCDDYWLTGIGKFCQGSGFDKEEAEQIARLLNGEDTSTRRPLKNNLDRDLLMQLLERGGADAEAQQDAARWIRAVYANPDHYDRDVFPDGPPCNLIG